jgi:hypothetical protein
MSPGDESAEGRLPLLPNAAIAAILPNRRRYSGDFGGIGGFTEPIGLADVMMFGVVVFLERSEESACPGTATTYTVVMRW